MGVCCPANKAADTAILALYDSLVRVTNVGSHSNEFLCHIYWRNVLKMKDHYEVIT